MESPSGAQPQSDPLLREWGLQRAWSAHHDHGRAHWGYCFPRSGIMVHLASRRRNGWVRVRRGGPILSEGTDVSPVSATIAVTKGEGASCYESVTVWDRPENV